MLLVFKVVFKIAMLLVGTLVFYTATTMFPDEEGALQNRIENLWIIVDDKQKSATGRAIGILNRVASYVTRVYNRILGSRLVSVQMVGVSSSSSIAGFFIFAALLFFTLLYLALSRHVTVTPRFNAALLLVGIACLVIGFVALIFAVVPSVIRNWFGRTISLLPFLFFSDASVLVVRRQHGAVVSNTLTVLAGLMIGILTDILVLAAVRLSVRLIANTDKVIKIIWAVLLQVGALILIVLIPLEVTTPLLAVNKDSLIAKVLLSSMMFNFFTVLGISAFLLILIVMTVHRALWPTLGRLIYSIARFQPLQTNRTLFAIIGIVCMLYGLGVIRWTDVIVWFAQKLNPLK
jgi:hypothetical protein